MAVGVRKWRHQLFNYCIFDNQTFQLKNVPYQKERHIDAGAKVNEKIVPNLYLFTDAYCDCANLLRILSNSQILYFPKVIIGMLAQYK